MTTRRLVLIRHAKAEAQASTDSVRALAPRGRRDATALGRWLAEHDITPDLVVISPARRTRETWELAVHELAIAPPVTIDPRMYENTIEDLLDVIRESDADISTLVLVGHNPSIESTASVLDDESGSASRDELRRGFPTSGIAVLSVDGDWADAGPEKATLEHFAAPRG